MLKADVRRAGGRAGVGGRACGGGVGVRGGRGVCACVRWWGGRGGQVDDSGASVGKRYARNDELGVPLAVTVDFDSVGHNDNGLAGTVTLRERDSCTQARPGGRGRRPLSVVGDCRRRRRRRRRWWCARARSPLRMGA